MDRYILENFTHLVTTVFSAAKIIGEAPRHILEVDGQKRSCLVLANPSEEYAFRHMMHSLGAAEGFLKNHHPELHKVMLINYLEYQKQIVDASLKAAKEDVNVHTTNKD